MTNFETNNSEQPPRKELFTNENLLSPNTDSTQVDPVVSLPHFSSLPIKRTTLDSFTAAPNLYETVPTHLLSPNFLHFENLFSKLILLLPLQLQALIAYYPPTR